MKQLLTVHFLTRAAESPLISCTYVIDFSSTFVLGLAQMQVFVISHICEMLWNVCPDSFCFCINVLIICWYYLHTDKTNASCIGQTSVQPTW